MCLSVVDAGIERSGIGGGALGDLDLEREKGKMKLRCCSLVGGGGDVCVVVPDGRTSDTVPDECPLLLVDPPLEARCFRSGVEGVTGVDLGFELMLRVCTWYIGVSGVGMESSLGGRVEHPLPATSGSGGKRVLL